MRIPEGNAPHTINRSYTITAEVEIHSNEAEGPICAIGGVSTALRERPSLDILLHWLGQAHLYTIHKRTPYW